jgi:hypothetical protein
MYALQYYHIGTMNSVTAQDWHTIWRLWWHQINELSCGSKADTALNRHNLLSWGTKLATKKCLSVYAIIVCIVTAILLGSEPQETDRPCFWTPLHSGAHTEYKYEVQNEIIFKHNTQIDYILNINITVVQTWIP